MDCFSTNFLIIMHGFDHLSCSCRSLASSVLCRHTLFGQVLCFLLSTSKSFSSGGLVFGVVQLDLSGFGVDGFGLFFCCIRLHGGGHVCRITAFYHVENSTHIIYFDPYFLSKADSFYPYFFISSCSHALIFVFVFVSFASFSGFHPFTNP